jgi:hypothetical protein
VQLYVNEREVTHLIEPAASLNDTDVTKIVSFTEPSGLAALAVKGLENNEFFIASLMLKCSCTRAESKWNFFTARGLGWRSVKAEDPRLDVFPAGWYTNEFAGTQSPTPQFFDSYSLDTSCGSLTGVQQLKANQGSPASFYWTMRQTINQTVCGTNNPTVANLNVQEVEEEDMTTNVAAVTIAAAVVGTLVLLAGAFLVMRKVRARGASGANSPDWNEQLDDASGSTFWIK